MKSLFSKRFWALAILISIWISGTAAIAVNRSAGAFNLVTPTASIPSKDLEKTVTPSPTKDRGGTNSSLVPLDVLNANKLVQIHKAHLSPLGTLKEIVWAPDGKWLAAVGTGGLLMLDGESLKIIRELSGPDNAYQSISISSDGKRLAAVSAASLTAQIWNTQDGTAFQKIPATGSRVALSPDGRYLASVEDDPQAFENSEPMVTVTLKIFRVDTGQFLRSMMYKTGSVENMPPETTGLVFSQNGQKVVVMNALGDIRYWEVLTGKNMGTSINDATRPRYNHGICSPFISGNAVFVLSCDIVYLDPPCVEETPGCMPETKRRYEIGFWETEQAKRYRNQIIFNPEDLILNGVYDLKTQTLGLFYKNKFEWWGPKDLSKPEKIWSKTQLIGPSQSMEWLDIPGALLALKPGSQAQIMAAAYQGKIELWSVQESKLLARYDNDPRQYSSAALGVWKNSPALALGLSDGSIQVIQLKDSVIQQEIKKAHNGRVTHLAFGQGEGTLISAGNDRKINFWAGTVLKQSFDFEGIYTTDYFYLFDYAEATHSLVYPFKEKNAKTADLVVQNLKTGQLEQKIKVESQQIAISQDGLWLATGIYKPALWNIQKAAKWREFYTPGFSFINHLALSPNGSTLAAVQGDTFLFWDANSAKLLIEQKVAVPASWVNFSPTGCLAVGGDNAGNLYLFDLNKKALITQFKAHAGRVQEVNFSRDGRLLASFGADGTASVWGLPGALGLQTGLPAVLSCNPTYFHFTSTPVTPTMTPSKTSTQPTSTLLPFYRPLSLTEPAMTGPDVLQLQKRLVQLGFKLGTPDGVFGPKTDQAVRQFQEQNGLVVDGIVGPLTWKKLFP
jgi:WD40 repeat protein